MGLTIDKLDELDKAIEEEREEKELGNSLDEMVETRKEVKRLTSRCAKVCNTVNTTLNSVDANAEKLKEANKIVITPEAKEYLDSQSKAICQAMVNELEVKSRKIIARMTYQSDRVQIPTSACYLLCVSLVILIVQFVLLCFLNYHVIHNEVLEEFCWGIGGILVGTDTLTIAMFCWLRNHE